MHTSEPVRTSVREGALEVFLLGTVDFDSALFLQERLMMDVAQRELDQRELDQRELDQREGGQRDGGLGVLLVCEHPPLITIGREGSRADIACGLEELTARQIEVRWLNRGGGALVHVPGQLALYPIVPLVSRGLGLAAYRERLELAMIDTCRELRIRAQRNPGGAGVFCRGGQVAQVGVAVRQGVSSHGLFLNVNPRMDAVRLVRSGEIRTSSLAAERGIPVPMPSVRESLIRRLAARLEYDRYHLYTGHALLRRTKRVVAYA